MDDAIRLLYLEAMGITVWKPKASNSPVSAPPSAGAGNTPSEAIALHSEDPPYAAPTPPLPPPASISLAASSDYAAPNDVAEMDWDTLEKTVSTCPKCRLCETRTQTVFGSGDKKADWLIVGEGPGQQEDLQGLPFVGPAGQLLTEMLRAIGLGRNEVYIANIVKCRPPNNRDPKPDEADACRPYLDRQIALIRPKIILAVGRIAAQSLLRTEAAVSKLRGRTHTLNQTPVVVVYHPSYLLRSPGEKKKAWLDLQLALNTYREQK
ncbi:uracil-DNA glycosylase [Methylomicrobium sp. RS1]|uniref:uracil-DNA glycosylase n=1 Tax=Candidatus Methylomicrobium oryzae TaxID=2802053 RepID=UPI00192221D4|nr:uracil-DNA glycosylase [Methylomicrobium sp. RS1]MBL1262771.1 uracil-DNA glycosylase [Methylomicrobium sp. RS1]